MALLMHGQKGNLNFLQEVSKMNASNSNAPQQQGKALVKKVQFVSEGENIVGNLFFPDDFDAGKQYPAVIVSGSWTTVKEQMAGLYAEKLAKEGFITLAFDFRNFGESGGEPRFYENPQQKVADIKSAVSYLQSLPEVNADTIGALGICAIPCRRLLKTHGLNPLPPRLLGCMMLKPSNFFAVAKKVFRQESMLLVQQKSSTLKPARWNIS